jgi:integrase/recombinase XerD
MVKSAPRTSDHWALGFESWPAADVDAWVGANRCPDFLEDGGHGATWRPASVFSARGTYGRWLGWLVTQGVDLALEVPGARMTEERMRNYVTFLQVGRSSVTVASYLGVLSMVALAMFPKQDWRWLQAVQRQLAFRLTASRRKADRLVPADALVQLGLDLMQRAEPVLDAAKATPETVTKRQVEGVARDFRDGLMIAVQGSRPLRVKNLLMTKLGQHLHISAGQITLHLAASETKGKRAYRTTWPEGDRRDFRVLPVMRERKDHPHGSTEGAVYRG